MRQLVIIKSSLMH